MSAAEITRQRDEYEREATRPLELMLRSEIRRREITNKKLAELLGLLPVGADFLMNRTVGYWSFRECIHVAKALELKTSFVLSSTGTTPLRLMAE